MTNTNASFGAEVQRKQQTENPRVGGFEAKLHAVQIAHFWAWMSF